MINIGGIKINYPIFQGGMGVKISGASLASAVANCGGAGTIACVGLGGSVNQSKNYRQASIEALKKEITQSKRETDGIVGANIMVALSNYQDLVETAIQEKVDFIASGAGLPLDLPKYVAGLKIEDRPKLIPIVSSLRVVKIIVNQWKRKFDLLPDAIIVEGPLAGGHLGFNYEELISNTYPSLAMIIDEILSYFHTNDIHIPLIAAGGIWTKKDMDFYLGLGVKAVQLGTKFVLTKECKTSSQFKKAYILAKKENIQIIKSPVGMPGRAIFYKEQKPGGRINCNYQCLKNCDPKTAPYCIAQAMFNAYEGSNEQPLVFFAGYNVYRAKKITSVEEIFKELT